MHPSALIQNEIAEELSQQEFEVYIIRDHIALRKVLKRYPDSIVFVYIDDRLPEKEWEAWIRGVMTDPETAGIAIGVLSSTADETLQRKYVNSIKVQCGFVLVKPTNVPKIVQRFFEILSVLDAKGRRKYIRAITEGEAFTSLNMFIEGEFVTGNIMDISSVGLSCVFPEEIDLPKNAYFNDIQLKLRSVLLKVEGIVFGSRMSNGQKAYVFLFTQRIDPDAKTRIRKYIQSMLQEKMNEELKQA